MTELALLQKNVQKTHEWLNEISAYAGWEDKNKALAALRATLQQLRDNLPLENAVYLGAQLPLLIRGLYYENWRPLQMPLKERKEEIFLNSIEDHLRELLRDFWEEIDAKTAAQAVLRTLSHKISLEEVEKIMKVLPKEIRLLWQEARTVISASHVL